MGDELTNTHTSVLANTLANNGLLLRGAFSPTPSDQIPPLPHGETATTLVLVGVAGSAMWSHFAASGYLEDGKPHPLDRWSRSIGDALAQRLQGLALYPFEGPPYYPFQRWADRCEPTHSSPLMLRIHPEYGLWHAYRFALALPHSGADIGDLRTELASDQHRNPDTATDLCAQCSGQPCLNACPVEAFAAHGYHVNTCTAHLHTESGQTCLQSGCLARTACPEGIAFRYTPEHMRFHMQAFLQAHPQNHRKA